MFAETASSPHVPVRTTAEKKVRWKKKSHPKRHVLVLKSESRGDKTVVNVPE
jgi:hypothetical protein